MKQVSGSEHVMNIQDALKAMKLIKKKKKKLKTKLNVKQKHKIKKKKKKKKTKKRIKKKNYIFLSRMPT